jgi:hypothetical protein
MKATNLIPVVSVSILLILNVYLAERLRNDTRNVKETVIQYENKLIMDSLEIQNLKAGLSQIFWFSKSETRQFFRKIFPEWKGEEKLILFIRKGQCLACIKASVMDFELLQQETGYKEMVILGDFDKKEDFYHTIYKINPDFTYTLVQINSYFPFFCEYPSVFILNRDYLVKYFFIPEFFPELRGEYFYNVLLKYLKR